MMINPTFALMLAVNGLAASTPVMPGPRPADTVRDACIETRLERSAFESLARARRWNAAQAPAGAGAGAWTLMYRGDDAVIILTRPDGSAAHGPAGAGSVCMVALDRPPRGLLEDIDAMAERLGFRKEPARETPDAGPMQVWSKPGEFTMTYAVGVGGDRRTVISVSRQIVTSAPASAAPSGN